MTSSEPQQSRSLLGLRRADQITPTVTPWLINGWLVENTLAGLVAASGACKSFLAIDWACCIATGTPWNGHAVKQGPVCYLAGEGTQGLRKRIAAWERYYQVSVTGAPLYISGGLPYLCNDTNAVASIDEMHDATLAGPSFVVVDTVARAMGGANENSAEDMSALVRSMDWFRRECKATVLSVHHTGNDPANQARARGSSAYRAALDSEFLLRAVGLDEIELSTSKSKDWAAGEAMRLRKTIVSIEIPGQEESSLVLQRVTSMKAKIDKRPQAVDLRAQGVSIRKIAAELNVHRSRVERWLKPCQEGPDAEATESVSSRPPYTGGADKTVSQRDRIDETARDSRDSVAECRRPPEDPAPRPRLVVGGQS